MKNWHTFWHVGTPSWKIGMPYSTFIDMLARKDEKLACFWHICIQAHWHINHTGTQVCWHVDHIGTYGMWFSKLKRIVYLVSKSAKEIIKLSKIQYTMFMLKYHCSWLPFLPYKKILKSNKKISCSLLTYFFSHLLSVYIAWHVLLHNYIITITGFP